MAGTLSHGNLSGTVQSLPAGMTGFDCNTVLTASTAAAFVGAGFGFAIRYLSRTTPEPSSDLTASEARTILAAGLALMAVQHVSASGWVPSQALGQQYGAAAVQNAGSVGLPAGMNIWLDLEGVAAGTAASAVIAYCNAWFAAVSGAHYAPGLYVGANCGLDGSQLYHDLTCQYYWKSGSTVPMVSQRGYCLVQKIDDDYVLDGVSYDLDTVQADNMGNTPLALTPAASALIS